MIGTIKRTHIKLRGRVVPTCSHGECEVHRIWDYQTCWKHMSTTEQQSVRERILNEIREKSNFKEIVLSEVNLSGIDFTGVDLSGALLGGCNLSNANLVEANLRRAFFGGANLSNADLTRSELDGAVFSGAKMQNVKMTANSISFGRTPINLDRDCFGENSLFERPHINEENPYTAGPVYRSLKRYYIAEGEYDYASWAAYCERLMDERVYFRKRQYFNWFGVAVFGWLAGYGEKPLRPLLSSIMIILLYSLIYSSFGLLEPSNTIALKNWFDSIYFSGATFCTLSFSDIVPTASILARLVSTSEAFVGLFMWGLYIFTLTNRFVAR